MTAITATTQPTTPSPQQTPPSPPSPRTPSPKDDALRQESPAVKRPSPTLSPARRVQRRLEASVNPYARSPSETANESRTEDDRRSPRGRRGREEFVRDEVIIPSQAVGFIIGRQGETIRAIMAASGAHVSMDKHFPGPDRKFDITGNAAEVSKCRQVMLEKMEVVRERSQERSSGRAEETFEMWIPQAKIGMVIGAGGSNIRMINERSGAQCVVQNEKVRGEDKLLMIYGSREGVRMAEDMVLELLQGRTETKAIYIPKEGVGFVIGKNGAMIKNLMMRSGASIKVSSEEGEERLVTIQGSARVIEEAHCMIERVLERGFAERDKPRKMAKETFELSAEHIGLLIGKHGVTIREMQNRSGATIEVSGKNEEERGAATRTVNIVGSRAQVRIAKILIEEKLGLDEEDEGIEKVTKKEERDAKREKSDKKEGKEEKKEEDKGTSRAQPHHYPGYMHGPPPSGYPHYPPPPMYGEHMPPYGYYGQPPPYPPPPGYGRKQDKQEGKEEKPKSEKKGSKEEKGDYRPPYFGHPMPYPPHMYGGYPPYPPPPGYREESKKETAS